MTTAPAPHNDVNTFTGRLATLQRLVDRLSRINRDGQAMDMTGSPRSLCVDGHQYRRRTRSRRGRSRR